MSNLNPVKLHTIIGTSTAWTDELWEEALDYLLANTATPDAILMSIALSVGAPPDYPHKIDYLREFRKFPPTLLLGAFDLMRFIKHERAKREAEAEKRTAGLRLFGDAFSDS
ncbi:hypothetical protein ACFWY9_10285 [Amycolatopsis sp. NPDC059027]|uniref:hypothetical protein n=1 Tax=Amycolatopsis sp. NPDC059027 TaxID=3346709 RepID=UPI0036708769